MFKKITIKNFKSLTNVQIDLTYKKNTVKNFAAIYGPNGSGKSSIVQAFIVLKKTLSTMQLKHHMGEMIDELLSDSNKDQEYQNSIVRLLRYNSYKNSIEALVNEYKTINSTENMSLEFEFIIKGNTGSYYIEFDNTSIVKERLEYKLKERRGCYYNIDDEIYTINNSIFETDDLPNILRNKLVHYWGKHSLLSIIYNEMEEKSDTFINNSISANLMDVLEFFQKINIETTFKEPAANLKLYEDLTSGTVDISKKSLLTSLEPIIEKTLKNIFRDINKVYYKTKEEGSQISYTLFLNKTISGKNVELDFNKRESSGTKELLRFLACFLYATKGEFVIIDEYGTGIHDLLSANIIKAILGQITGQLIITTNNTYIMDSINDHPEYMYHITCDETYCRTISCVTEIEKRTHPNYNYKSRYITKNDLYTNAKPHNIETIELNKLAKLYEQLIN